MTVVRRSLVEGEGSVRRATLDLVVDGDEALVSLAWREGGVAVVCSCGGAPSCVHAVTALHWLEGIAESPGGAASGTVLPSTSSDPGGTRAPPVMSEPGRVAAPVQRSHALAAALDDLVTVVVRAGVGAAAGTPSLDESLRRLVAAAPAPLPTAIARAVGRLREALALRDVEMVAQLGAGLGRLADALRNGDVPTANAWLGVAGAAALEGHAMPPSESRLLDAHLVELAREWVTTVDRAGLERRYLADPRSGALYREERLRGSPAPSLGPCPRTLAIALAEFEPGPAPRRLRLLQYEVALTPEPFVYTELATHAAGSFAPLLALYREQRSAFPALAEPLVLVAPHSLERTPTGADLVDAEGARLALLSESRAVTAALLACAANDVPSFVVGRLVTADGALALVPLSIVLGPDDAPSLRRLT